MPQLLVFLGNTYEKGRRDTLMMGIVKTKKNGSESQGVPPGSLAQRAL